MGEQIKGLTRLSILEFLLGQFELAAGVSAHLKSAQEDCPTQEGHKHHDEDEEKFEINPLHSRSSPA